MVEHEAPRQHTPNGRESVGRRIVYDGGDNEYWRTVYRDKQGYFINLNYGQRRVFQKDDGTWWLVPQDIVTCPHCKTSLVRLVEGYTTVHYVYRAGKQTTLACPICGRNPEE